MILVLSADGIMKNFKSCKYHPLCVKRSGNTPIKHCLYSLLFPVTLIKMAHWTFLKDSQFHGSDTRRYFPENLIIQPCT